MSIVSDLRKHYRKVITLEGFTIGYHLPDVTECLLDAVAAAPEDRAKQLVLLRRLVVASMLDDVNGETVQDAERIAVARAFSAEHRTVLFDLVDMKPDHTTTADDLSLYEVKP